MVIPRKRFLVYPMAFAGPCRPKNIGILISGTILAPDSPQAWKGRNQGRWLIFQGVNGLNISGSGMIDGRAKNWWDILCANHPQLKMVSFLKCNGTQMSNISLANSPQTHIHVMGCNGVSFNSLTINTPGSSPNTDGIHIQSSHGVTVKGTNIGCGDDCISIGDHTSNIYISDTSCGPGHGVSIGSLGKSGNEVQVENITVTRVQFKNTSNGVRIKTWQTGKGHVRGVKYQNLNFTAVENPLIIDQHYCNVRNKCKPTDLCTIFLVICCVSTLACSTTVYSHGSDSSGDIFDVMKYGAAGDGETDDSQEFLKAWEAVCGATASSPILTIPAKRTFLLSPVSFRGPCKSPSINVQISGDIVAPSKSDWTDKDQTKWIHFIDVKGLEVSGNGSIDGQGSSWWKSCENSVTGLNMVAPETSPNTDGIDICNSKYVTIQDSQIATGDDCIAITGGSSYINITRVTCGPGHGISVGSLGKDGETSEVEEVHVRNCTFKGTQNGARIKTWQGGSGYARKISFVDIILIAAKNPILIDQFYCDHKHCQNKDHSTIFLVLCMVVVVSSALGATKDLVSSASFSVISYGAIGDGTTDDSQAFMKAWKAACEAQSLASTVLIPAKNFLLKPMTFSGPCTSSRVYVQALTFNRCNGLRLNGLTHINSPRSHITITHCNGAVISNLRIIAPETSPNTDGIDISGSTSLQVRNSYIGTGDDCIAISGGSSNINISRVTCGPGHGISIGALGHGGYDTVEDIHVKNCTFKETLNGVRLKTWQDHFTFFLVLCMVFRLAMSVTNNDLVSSSSFIVTNFGAVGDGISDDSQAFLKAWKAACEAQSNASSLVIPRNRIFLLKPATFSGPCTPSRIYFLLSGNLVAPNRKSAWVGFHINSWLTFANVNGLTINGRGQGETCKGPTVSDDCVAISGGSSNVTITGVTCGPGHGISIGALGHGGYDTVEDILVRNCTLNGTTNGVRIKSWQGGEGYARKISFEKIKFVAVNNPIIIDQYYCPNRVNCQNKTSAIKLSDISYRGILGTSTTDEVINLSCSESVGCTNIVLDHVYITSTIPGKKAYSNCINAYGRCNHTIPTVKCLL
ncbi:hypothetical protein RJ640_021246 [Escallonia rubra]|uniref:Polygalacturonase n=1 Tax=Escallonia rubra TaxID=112253 RepID=A0AA88R2X1_9ASTE|nr:hypothetical protein RJ640_021246 [Escallonia rubra]